MKKFDNVIKQYLEMETNFSIMISGSWGAGKTYYYKNQIFELINKTEVFGDNSKKYKPIIISLFGIKNIEDLQSQLFLSLYPFLKNKKIKIGSSIAKTIVKGVLMIKGLGEYTKMLDNVNIKGKDFLNFNELVICFDDLERLSKNLELKEIIGFVNNLVENENAKIVLIANEDKIEDADYKVLKEKVVGNTVEFNPDMKETTDNIINKKFSGYKTYQKFLQENEKLIYDCFFQNSKNLRTLTYALSYFHKIFSNLELEIPNHSILDSHKNVIFHKVFKFTLAISIEIKEGNLDFKNRENLDTNLMTALGQIRLENFFGRNKTDEEKEEVKDYKDNFLEKYFSQEKFDFFTSVYDYLTGGSVLDISHLIVELNEQYHIEENEIREQYLIYNSLSYPNVYNLTDKEYIEKTLQLKEFAFNGNFKIGEYITLFYFLSRFDNPLNLKLEELEENLKMGIDKSVELNEKIYKQELDHYLSVSEKSENKEHLNNLRLYIIKKNDQINENNNNQELEELETLFYNDYEDFFKTIFNSESKYRYSPVFSKFDARKFCENFINNENSEKYKLLKYFKMKYKSSYVIYHKEELIFFKNLSTCITKNISDDKGVSFYLKNEFKEIIVKIYDKLKNHHSKL